MITKGMIAPYAPWSTLRATPDMDTRDCEAHNAIVADMLAALEACCEYLVMIPESAVGGDDEAVALARRVRAVLSKARGK